MAEGATGQEHVGAQGGDDRSGSGRSRLSRRFIAGAVLLLLVGLAAGIAYGWATTPGGSSIAVPSPEQEEALGSLGRPPAFWLTDGAGTPAGEDHVRVEQWLYPAEGTVLTFVDGHLTGTVEVTFTEPFAGSPVSPTELDSTMSESDVSALLGEAGMPTEADDAGYPEYEAFVYPESRIAVGFSQGRLLTAQTY